MEKRLIFYARMIAGAFLTLSALIINSFTANTYAQVACSNQAVLFSESFGTGTTATTNPDILTDVLTYHATGLLAAEGTYRVINNTQQKPEWFASEDHTAGDVNGKMLVINSQAGAFYSHRVDRPTGFIDGDNYTASLFLMNVDTLGTCGPNPLLPMITFRVEYLSQANTWVPLTGSPYTAPAVPRALTPTWVPLGSSFVLPNTGSFLVKSLRVVLSNVTAGGCGNDFALDDVQFALCATAGPTPVTFLNIDARQKGSGVRVDWSTAQEFNSQSFVVEKSADGNSNWNVVSSVNAAGNSSTVKNYNAYDAQPFKGINFYRIRQVDKDANFKYSKTVSIKLNFNTTGVSVLTNPFHNLLTVDFSSSISQAVSARLVDITGKQVAAEKWSINSGSTRKDFSGINGLQQGIYILTVTGAGGETLYNNKVIKQ